jgi:hypothetical protein
MTEGGCLMTVTFFGAEKVVEHYNMMGPVKAALESSVRYMAAELGRPRHSRACIVPRSHGDPRRVRDRPFRRTARAHSGTGADPPPRHGRGHRAMRRFPGQRRREATDESNRNRGAARAAAANGAGRTLLAGMAGIQGGEQIMECTVEDSCSRLQEPELPHGFCCSLIRGAALSQSPARRQAGAKPDGTASLPCSRLPRPSR